MASLLLLGVSACATVKPKPAAGDEPTPKEDVAEADAAAPSAPATIETAPATPPPDQPKTPPPAPPPDQPKTAPPAAQPAPPPAAPAFAPAFSGPPGKPRILAKVEALQFPAWVERRGIKASIKAGWAIYTGDRIMTGADGRLTLTIAGEGRLKFGGNADAVFAESGALDAGGPQASLLRVNQGPFHFTASPMERSGTRVEIGTAISANVLGGQMVGRADYDEAALGLLEGKIEVTGPKLNPGVMSKRETYLRVPRGGKAQPVSPLPQERLARWVSQTEPVSGRPSLNANGVWDVSLNSGYNLKQIEEMACRVQARGYPGEVYPVREPGKQVWYRVVVRRFASRNDAVGFLGTAKGLGSKEPWVLLPQS